MTNCYTQKFLYTSLILCLSSPFILASLKPKRVHIWGIVWCQQPHCIFDPLSPSYEFIILFTIAYLPYCKLVFLEKIFKTNIYIHITSTLDKYSLYLSFIIPYFYFEIIWKAILPSKYLYYTEWHHACNICLRHMRWGMSHMKCFACAHWNICSCERWPQKETNFY